MPPKPPLRDFGQDDNATPLVSSRRSRSLDFRRDGKQDSSVHTRTAKNPPPSRRGVISSTLGLFQKWWQELLCCILVLATLLAITATLYPFSGKPLPQWPYGLSINALLSIYVLMMKAAMLFLVAQGMPCSWHADGASQLIVIFQDWASSNGNGSNRPDPYTIWQDTMMLQEVLGDLLNYFGALEEGTRNLCLVENPHADYV